MNDALTVGSLFAGIGGFDLGFERAGMRSLWQCEVDPFAQQVLAQHWPSVLRVSDVRRAHAEDPSCGCENCLPRVGVLCGGFPCQDLSVAGKGAGIEGSRSGLWQEYARLIGELRPRYVAVENVSALRGRGLGRVLGDLAALGFDAEWDCIPASAVGAPHQRDRLWLVAYPQCEQLREQPGRGSRPGGPEAALAPVDGEAWVLADAHSDIGDAWRPGDPAEGARGRDPDRSPLRTDCVADPQRAGLEGHRAVAGQSEVAQPGDQGWWAAEPDVGRVAHGVPARVDRLRALGNALVPQIAEWLGRRIVAHHRGEVLTVFPEVT